MKAQVKRQVEQDLKRDFDSRFETLQRRLKDRDDKISQLENLQVQKDSEAASQERELHRVRLEHEKQAKT